MLVGIPLCLTRSFRLASGLFLSLSALTDLELTLLLFDALRRRHRDFQNSIAEIGGRVLDINPLWQGYGAIETTVGTLGAVIAFVFLFAFISSLAANPQCTIGNLNVDVIFGHAGKICSDYELIVPLNYLHLRRPHF